MLNVLDVYYLFFLINLDISSCKAINAGSSIGRKTKHNATKPTITAMANSIKRYKPDGMSVANVPPSIIPADITTPPTFFDASIIASFGESSGYSL